MISSKDLKLLWGRAAGRCSICRIELSQEKQFATEIFPLGEHAHIVAEQEKGPRGESILSQEERDSYHNFILLCPTCHTLIDKNEEDFPPERLYIMKSEHELWVQKSLAETSDLQCAYNLNVARNIESSQSSPCIREDCPAHVRNDLQTRGN